MRSNGHFCQLDSSLCQWSLSLSTQPAIRQLRHRQETHLARDLSLPDYLTVYQPLATVFVTRAADLDSVRDFS